MLNLCSALLPNVNFSLTPRPPSHKIKRFFFTYTLVVPSVTNVLNLFPYLRDVIYLMECISRNIFSKGRRDYRMTPKWTISRPS